MRKWEEKSFDEIGFIGRGKSRFRPRNAAHLYGGEFPFIQTGDIKAASFRITEYSQTYSEAGLAQSKLWKEGTLCITVAANIADTAILGMDACFPDSVIGFVADENKCDVRFVKYFFDVFQAKMKSISTGAAQDNLSLEKLLTFKMPTPPLSIQRKIAAILSAYDGLIENNVKRIKLLEEGAMLRYKGIVKNETLKEVILGEVCTINKRTLKGDGLNDTILYVDISSVTQGSINEKTEYEMKDAPGRAKRIVKHQDIIWSCVRPNRKSFSLVWKPEENLIVSTGFAVISSEQISPLFLYQCLATEEFVKYLENNATGSAYPAVGAKDFEKAKILIPSKETMMEYQVSMTPIFNLIHTLQQQNASLRSGRDLLLPRLMSGAIEVL